jgi:hypothetical protein
MATLAPQAGKRSAKHRKQEGASLGLAFRHPVTVTITLLPGPEPWVRVECGPSRFLVPGATPSWELVLKCLGRHR